MHVCDRQPAGTNLHPTDEVLLCDSMPALNILQLPATIRLHALSLIK